MTSEHENKFRACFENMAVYKDLKNGAFFSALGLPSFMRDWLLQRHQNRDGQYEPNEVQEFVNRFLPREQGWFAIKDRIINDYETVKLLAKIRVDINIASGDISFSLPYYGLKNSETMIDFRTWETCKNQFSSGDETWALIELGYRPPDPVARPKIPGKIKLVSLKNFCPYEIDIDYYKDARAEFGIEEWLDILLGAVDYHPDGYRIAKNENQNLPEPETMKLTFLSRLLPFMEKRLNLVELAPKGTGKSYVFGQLSRFGWLSTSDKLTRAKLFYDSSKRLPGLITHNDFLAVDEIQKTHFDADMGAILQGYLEQGVFTVGDYSGAGNCGMILCGNAAPELMEADGKRDLFGDLPPIFNDPALIDRFHGFIRGWLIPRMNDDLKICGWALNSEYFTTILHELRNDGSYRAIIDEIIETPKGADTRDTEAIKRVATGFLKLLFPHARKPEHLNAREFNRYCLRPAKNMRLLIKRQLSLKDKQYRYMIPELEIKKSLIRDA